LADRLEQVILVGFYGWLCWRLLPQEFPPPHWYPLMLLISEGMVLLFILIRRSTEKISISVRDWGFALGGTLAPLLVENTGNPFLPRVGSVLMLIGFIVHFGAKLSLTRSFGMVPADRGIKTLGLYAIVRHPMYFGYMVSHIGYLLAVPSIWNTAIYSLAWAFLFGRIILEERLLSENPDYRAYYKKVQYRLIPRVF
jgi:protein-S-isoprenylcysteine O-methyltransferase Ste14